MYNTIQESRKYNRTFAFSMRLMHSRFILIPDYLLPVDCCEALCALYFSQLYVILNKVFFELFVSDSSFCGFFVCTFHFNQVAYE